MMKKGTLFSNQSMKSVTEQPKQAISYFNIFNIAWMRIDYRDM